MRTPILAFVAAVLTAAPAWAAPMLITTTFNADFEASQSLWGGGPSAGLDVGGRTSGSVGAYYEVKANSGTVNARQNAGIAATFLTEQAAGAPAQITLDFMGDAGGGFVEALFGASAEAGVFLDIAGCLGVITPFGCAGIPYNIDEDIPIISEGFFLAPSTTHSPVIDVQRSANDADTAFGKGLLNTPIGSLGPTMNLDLDQTIYFTPTGLTGTAFYRNVGTGATGTAAFTLPGDGPMNLQLALGVGTWEVSFLNIALQNMFRNDIDLELRPAFDYIVGSWPPPGSGPIGVGLIDETFALGFNHVQNLGSVRFNVVGPAAVPEPVTLVLMGVGLSGVVIARRRQKRRSHPSVE
jgi:hypothetical protein